jgi:arginine N-succinyltransferase
VSTDDIRTIRAASESRIVVIAEGGETKILGSCGRLADFRAAYAFINQVDGGIMIDPAGAALLGVTVGDQITHVDRW